MLTVKAYQLLESCDAVVYDRLVALDLIAPLPRRVERHYVGKSAGKHTIPQGKINRLLVELAQKGLTVVRLKGGDPYVFGCGGIEAIYLRQHNIPFKVVPGITAGIAGPASAGIPVTHRGIAAYSVFLTAHEASDKEKSGLPYELFSRMSDGTLVGYMGVKQLPQVTLKLREGGMSPETPVSLIERGTLGVERVVIGNLENIVDKAKAEKISPPALFVIGEVVNLRDEILAQSEKPLQGRTVMATRPGDQALEMYHALREMGAEPLALPSIATVGDFNQEEWERLAELESGWLLFTSENGVRYFHQSFLEQNFDIRLMARFRIAVVGSGTQKSLRQWGIEADFVPTVYTVSTLAEELTLDFDWEGINIVRVRGNLADETLEEALAEAGAVVHTLHTYRTFTAEWNAGDWAAFEEAEIDAVTFTSGSTVTSLKEILGAERFISLLERAAAVSIGPMTSGILRENGVEPAVEANPHTIAGVVDSLVGYFGKK